MARKAALGRGLEALMATINNEDRPANDSEVRTIAVDRIDPDPAQPRRAFSAEALEELAQSIRSQGVLQPVLVQPEGEGRYRLVAGERRWRAAQRAGLHEIPAIVRRFEGSKALEAALVENVQRADLNPMEEAQALGQLASDHGLRQEDLARLTGKSRSHIANMLRLLALPAEVQEHLRQGDLTLGHAKALAGSDDPIGVAREAVRLKLSVRQVEERLRKGASPARSLPRHDPDLADLEATLSRATGARASLRNQGNHGQLVLEWTSLEMLDRLVALLTDNGRLG